MPDAVVLVATVRAIKYWGNYENLDKHIQNIRTWYNLPCVVAINRFADDTDEDIANLIEYVNSCGVEAVVCTHFAEGGVGAQELAHEVVTLLDGAPTTNMKFTYEDDEPLYDKIRGVARKIYGAKDISLDAKLTAQLKQLQQDYGHYPICIAKTQSSFSDDPNNREVFVDHTLTVRELRLCSGAGFIVVVCGNIMTLPGLPTVPNAERISVDSSGNITGLD